MKSLHNHVEERAKKRNTNYFISFVQGAGYDDTQLNKVNKGRQKRRILEKMNISIINMYQLLVT